MFRFETWGFIHFKKLFTTNCPTKRKKWNIRSLRKQKAPIFSGRSIFPYLFKIYINLRLRSSIKKLLIIP